LAAAITEYAGDGYMDFSEHARAERDAAIERTMANERPSHLDEEWDSDLENSLPYPDEDEFAILDTYEASLAKSKALYGECPQCQGPLMPDKWCGHCKLAFDDIPFDGVTPDAAALLLTCPTCGSKRVNGLITHESSIGYCLDCGQEFNELSDNVSPASLGLPPVA
jgi:DNA-directed RNA polymerase subunit RPC12/RpoP